MKKEERSKKDLLNKYRYLNIFGVFRIVFMIIMIVFVQVWTTVGLFSIFADFGLFLAFLNNVFSLFLINILIEQWKLNHQLKSK